MQWVCFILCVLSVSVALTYPSYIYGQGLGPILLSQVDCKGNENNLTECSLTPSDAFLFHFFDTGVKCFNETCKEHTHIQYHCYIE